MNPNECPDCGGYMEERYDTDYDDELTVCLRCEDCGYMTEDMLLADYMSDEDDDEMD